MSNTFKGKFLSIFLSLLLILSLAAVVLPATPAKAAVTGVNITSPTNAVPLYGHTGGTLAIGFTVTATDITQGDLLLEVLTAGTSTAVATQPLYAVTLAIGVNTFSYSIGLTGVATGTYDVKVSALQPTGGGIWQASDIESNALVIDNTIPTVTLTNPNGGNYVSSSKDYTVYWNATDTVPAQDVYVGAMYSTDAGTSYPSTAFTTVPKARGTNSATWLAADIPDMDTLSARLQLTVTDTAGNSRVVTSASNFTIINSPPTVTISTPTTGTSWNGNSTQSITFTTVSTFSTNVDYKIELSLDSGGTYPTLITDWVTNRTPGLTTYSWKVDNTYRGSTAKIRVTVRDKAGNEGTPAISNAFTIADVTAPTVSVTAPTVGTIFYAGQTNQTISWTASDNVFSIGSVDQLLNYNIQLSTDGGTSWGYDIPLTDQPQGLNTYATWTVPTPLASSTNCKIKVTATDKATPTTNSGYAISPTFSILLGGSGPTVTVTSPNTASVSWQVGTIQSITWTATDASGNTVRLDYLIQLSINGGSTYPITIANLTNQPQGARTYSWAVDSSTPNNLNKIKITATNPASALYGIDSSDANFTITEADFAVEPATIALKQGWNLISLPLVPTNSNIENVLSTCIGRIDRVWACTGGTNGGTWSSYYPGGPTSLTTMVDGKGYWIKVTAGADTSFTFQGRKGNAPPASPPSYSVVQGWNLIGYKSTLSTHTILDYLGATNYNLPVIGFTNTGLTSGTYDSYTPNTDTLDTEKGYWVYFNSTGSYTPPSD